MSAAAAGHPGFRPGTADPDAPATTARSPARDPWLLLIVGLTALLDAVASVLRHVHLHTGLDLAIFDQAVWHLSRFETPLSSIKAENIFGDHFHPIITLLAPLYWVWSDPRMLLIAQAALAGASVIPVFLFARDRLERGPALALAGAYAAFWGLQTGVLFDFHEVAFAPLLIALAIRFADRRQNVRLAITTALLLCVKEDQSAVVAFLGLYLLTLRRIRPGLALLAAGIAWYELSTRVFIPHFGGGFTYWSYGELGPDPASAAWALVTAPWKLVTVGLVPARKAATLAALFAPFLFTSLFSRLMMLAIPLLAERFLSTNRDLWSTHFHYSMAIAPVLAMAAAEGLPRVAALVRRRNPIPIATATMLALGLLAAAAHVVQSRLHDTGFSVGVPDARAGLRILDAVPPGASLATVDLLLPHASQRREIDLIDSLHSGRYEYLVVNLRHLDCCGPSGNPTPAAFAASVKRALAGMATVRSQDGWILARRRGPATP